MRRPGAAIVVSLRRAGFAVLGRTPHHGGAQQAHDRLHSQTAHARLTSHQRKEHHVFNDNGSFLLALFEFFLFFAWFMCLFWVISDIFRSKDLSGVAKTFWVIFVIIVPWLGILVYLIARGHGMQERQLEQAKAMQAAQAEYIQSVAGSSGGSRPTRSPRRSRCWTPARSRRPSSTP